jgi:hypothetical protein
MVSTRTKIYHQNYLSPLGKRQGGNEDFQGTKKLIETKILSSKDLKPDEICILSKGLNFCPTPNKINEEQLSADLDKFARSFRIKEYFLAKERDFPVDGRSIRKIIMGSPFLGLRKKSSWNPKPSKNTTLESFIDLAKMDVQTAASTNIPTHNNLTPEKRVRSKN